MNHPLVWTINYQPVPNARAIGTVLLICSGLQIWLRLHAVGTMKIYANACAR